MDHHAVCEHNLRKLLLNNSRRTYTPEIGSRDDKELIFVAILFILSILCDVKQHVRETCLDLTDMTEWAIGQFRQWLALVIAAKGEHIEQHFDWCFMYCRYVIEIFSMCVVYMLQATKWNGPFFVCHPVHCCRADTATYSPVHSVVQVAPYDQFVYKALCTNDPLIIHHAPIKSTDFVHAQLVSFDIFHKTRTLCAAVDTYWMQLSCKSPDVSTSAHGTKSVHFIVALCMLM